jgi:hypothetical protein
MAKQSKRSSTSSVEAPVDAMVPGPAPSSEERAQWIATAAYYRAQQRGFTEGCELEDWLEAEKALEESLVMHEEKG